MIDFNFGADFSDFGGDFGASFGFDAYFGGAFGNFAFADFFGGSVTSDFEVDSCGSLHPMIRVVIAVDKEVGGIVVGLTNYSMSRV